jgi:hypothetical protein
MNCLETISKDSKLHVGYNSKNRLCYYSDSKETGQRKSLKDIFSFAHNLKIFEIFVEDLESYLEPAK